MFGVVIFGFVAFSVGVKWAWNAVKGNKVIEIPELNAEFITTRENNSILVPRSFNPDNLEIELNCTTVNDREIKIYPLYSEIDSYLILPTFIPEKCGFKNISVLVRNGEKDTEIKWDICQLISIEKIIEIFNEKNKTEELADVYD